MRFMSVIKAASENAGPPPQALEEAIGKMVAAGLQDGTKFETGGLAPSATGTRVRISRGTLTVTDGPYAEAKEIARAMTGVRPA